MRSPLVTRMQGYGVSIFARMSALAAQTGAINLGQGFPDGDGPPEVLRLAQDTIGGGGNQYPPADGVPALREAIATHQRDYYGLEVDAFTQTLVTVGATEAIACSVLALCQPGDEVVTFEPAYDSYAACVSLAGATRRTVPLRFPDFVLDETALRAAVTDRTRLILLNNPHNPSGRVFTRGELETIAQVARERDLIVLTDEVYEHLTYDGQTHVPIATLPGMWERTLTASSAGKSFSVTGWKVGWLVGPQTLVQAAATVKQFLTFGGSGPFQPAVAAALGLGANFHRGFAADLQARRDLLVDGLREAGMPVAVPSGTYFVVADAAPLGAVDGLDFCLSLPQRCGVVAVPVSAFCDDPELARTLVRFTFCKQESVLREASDRLSTLR